MTLLAGRPADDARLHDRGLQDGGRDASTLVQPDVPVRVSGTHLYGAQPGSGYVVPPALVRRVDGQVLQLTPVLYAVLEAIDGQRDLDEIAVVVSRVTRRHLLADDVELLVDSQLRPLGLVLGRDGT